MGLNTLQKYFVDQALRGANLFLTGQAGTGKSYTLSALMSEFTKRRIAYGITATTGIAALNVQGSTIHSWAGIGLGEEDAATLAGKVNKNKRAAERIRKTKVLIIDEISMCSKELFEKLDQVFRVVRRKFNLPFGGIQLILVGDWLQLPPVARQYEKSFCFESEIWKTARIRNVTLTEIVRQDATGSFAKLLSKIRTGEYEDADLDLLDSRFGFKFPNDGIKPVVLYCTNRNVEAFNNKELSKLEGEAVHHDAEDSGQANYIAFFDRNCPAPKVLSLKVGAQVMLLHNLSVEGGLVNGSIGVVEAFTPGKAPVVRFANGAQEVIQKHTWEAKEQVFDDNGGWRMRTAAKREQFPLKLAWSMTVHKSQGSTIDRVQLDASDAFEEGMIYVALSRVRSLDCLSIKSIDYSKIKVNQKCKRFYEQE